MAGADAVITSMSLICAAHKLMCQSRRQDLHQKVVCDRCQESCPNPAVAHPVILEALKGPPPVCCSRCAVEPSIQVANARDRVMMSCHGSRDTFCQVAAGSAHRVIHEAQSLGPSNDYNTRPGLEAHCDVIPFLSMIGSAACRRGTPAVHGTGSPGKQGTPRYRQALPACTSV